MSRLHVGKYIQAAAFAAVMCAAPALATPVSVTPTTVVLKPGNASELVTLTNESDNAARFEVNIQAWSETEDGKTNLVPTNELIVFPALLELPARGEKKIRLGAERLAGGVEKTYRLVIHELPQAATGQATLQIQVLTNMTLPVFVAPSDAQSKVKTEPPVIDNGTLRFTVANPGSAHFMLQNVNVVGTGSAGEAFNVNQKGWYVLAGGRRTFHVALGGDACRRASGIAIKAITDSAASGTETRLSIPAGTCGDGTPKFVEPQKTATPTP